jgi:phosphohistidine phosphatase
MKKILFIRHAKAEELSSEISDFERSLTLKGKAISRLVAKRLMEKEVTPGVIITSPAFRALETAIIFAEEYGIKPDNILLNSNVYYKMNFLSLPELLSLVSEENDTITLVGHNPSLTEVADILSREGCDFLPKCGIACISFRISTWSEVRRNTGRLDYILKP